MSDDTDPPGAGMLNAASKVPASLLRSTRRPAWPDGARCVVAISFDYDGPSVDVRDGHFPAGSRSQGLYAVRSGVPRVLRMLDQMAIPATFFVPGYDALCFPNEVRSIQAAGHEVGAHGYVHENWMMGEEEAHWLGHTHRILGDVLGAPPVGYRSPGGMKTQHTTRLLRDMGYLYDSSDKEDDLPFFPIIDGAPINDLVALPNNTSSLDDYPFYRVSYRAPSEILTHWQHEFDAIYNENGYFVLTLHPRAGFGSGSPGRVAMLRQMIAFIQSYQDVKFMTLASLARFVIDAREGVLPWRT